MSQADHNNGVILYDINNFSNEKWTVEQDFNRSNTIYANSLKYQTNSYNYLSKIGQWLKKFVVSNTNDNALKFLFASSKPWNEWKLAISNKDWIALLRDNRIEFYENLDKKECKWRVDIQMSFIKICNLCFNPNDEMLVFTDESGNMYFFDVLTGKELFSYKQVDSIEFENSICKIVFLDAEMINEKNFDSDVIEIVMTLSYSGYLNVFAVSSNKTVRKIYTQNLLSKIPNGIYCAEVDANLEYLVIGSFASYSSSSKNLSNGLSIWRILNQEPWIKHFDTLSEHIIDRSKYASKSNYNKMNFTKIEYVTKMAISPDNSCISVLYVSGKLSIYSFPSLKLINEWFMTEQPCYNDMNSDIVENPYELKKFKQIYREVDFRLVDVGWWNEKVLILARGSGLISLVSCDDLSNLMGRNQQWLNPFPSIYANVKNEFIILDCECMCSNHSFKYETELSDEETSSQNMNESYEINNSIDEYQDDDDEDSWYAYIVRGIRLKAYNLIGIERLNVPPKKVKFLRRKFSIFQINSTTPAELFERKLNAEEYGEALQLANTYNLDSDRVYLKQWNSKPITKSTINDYLSKIKKRSTILRECERRVPSNIDTAKALIEFGLHGTDLDSLIAINESDDDRFHYSQLDLSDLDDSFDKFNPQHVLKRKHQIEQIREEKLRLIDPAKLNLMQRDLCLTRFKLLTYLDRLNVYEEILGGPIKAGELFDHEKYMQIRSKPILEVALDYAREGDAKAVEKLFSYYHEELKDKQLEVLSNFPETLEPEVYAKLLPKIENGEVCMFEDPEDIRTDKDWIEYAEFRPILNQLLNKNESQNDDKPSGTNEFNVESIQTWYYKRITEIEQMSGLTDMALNLAELAIANGCKNINELFEYLQTLYTLVYTCRTSSSPQKFYDLDFVSKLTDLEKLTLIMSHAYETSSELYVKNLQEWLLPFIARRPTMNMRETLLKSYLLQVSKEDLHPCLKLVNLRLKQSAQTGSNPTAQKPNTSNLLAEVNLIPTVIECLYVNEKCDQLDLSSQLLGALVNLSKTIEPTVTNEQIKCAHEHLKACELFRKYGVHKSLAYIKTSCQTAGNCRDSLVKLTWFASKRTTQLKSNEWKDLMRDLQHLQATIYKHLITYLECTEIFLSSLLGSRNLESIKMAPEWLRDFYAVDKLAAVRLVIAASQEYVNASSNYLDPDIDFAQECLKLVENMIGKHADNDANVHQCVQLVKSENNLIKSLKLIAELDYSILPVQIRLKENKYDIIKDILDKNENVYKRYDRLIELAHLMNVAGTASADNQSMSGDELPQVRQLIAEHALRKNNIPIAMKMCTDLIRLNHGPGWLCVYKLSFSLALSLFDLNDVDYDSIKQNVYLALARHKFNLKSSKSLIESLLKIEQFLGFVVTYCDADCVEEILYHKLNVEHARFQLESSRSADVDTATPPAYFELTNLNKYYFNTERSALLDSKSFERKSQLIQGHLSKLTDLRRCNRLTDDQFKHAFNELSKLDASVLLGYLLELTDNQLVVFERLDAFKFSSSKSYEFYLYLLGLNIIRTEISQPGRLYWLYEFKASTVAEYIQKSVDLTAPSDLNAFKIYANFDRIYADFNHKTQLDDLNQGIDLRRFETDASYQYETILGLSIDVSTFKLACSLAKFYSLDLWEVYASYVKYLVLEHDLVGLTLAQVDDQVKPLLPVLNQKFDQFASMMNQDILPTIEGTNLDKLITFYTMLNDQTNVKLLKKLKSVNLTDSDGRGMDYKRLVEKPCETIERFLDESNLQFFTKLAAKLPVKEPLSPGRINLIWCLKSFWSGEASLDAFDSIADSVKKLELEADFVNLIVELTLSERSCTRLTVQTRRELIKRINKLVRQVNPAFVEKLTQLLTNIQKHLKLVESVAKVIDPPYTTRIDVELGKLLTHNDQPTDAQMDLVENILADLLFDGHSIEKLDQLIKLLALERTNDVKKLIKLSLNKLSNMAVESSDCSNKLNTLLETISAHLSTGSILTEEDVMECMRVFCNNQQVDINTRLYILEKLKHIIKSMNDDDLVLLLVYKTNAILLNCDCFSNKVQPIDSALINSQQKRNEFLLGLIDHCATDEHYNALLNIFRIWPKSSHHGEPADQNPQNLFLLKLVANSTTTTGKLIHTLAQSTASSLEVTTNDLDYLSRELLTGDELSRLNFLKLCLAFRSDHNEPFIVDLIRNVIQFDCFKLFNVEEDLESIENNPSYERLVNDHDLAALLMRNDFFTNIIDTKMYLIFAKYLIIHKNKQELMDVVRVLKTKGRLIDAAKILMSAENFYSAFRTLSVSKALIDKFFN